MRKIRVKKWVSKSVRGIDDPSLRNLEHAFSFRDAGGVEDLADSLLAFALPEVESGGGSVGEDVAADGFLGVGGVGHAGAGVSHDLVAHEDGHIELLADLLDLAQHPPKHLLPLRELAPAREIHAEGRHDGVDHQQRELVRHHRPRRLHDERVEAVHGEGPADHDIVKHLHRVQVEAHGNLLDPLWTAAKSTIDLYKVFSVSM